jgi:hypothetical protein
MQAIPCLEGYGYYGPAKAIKALVGSLARWQSIYTAPRDGTIILLGYTPTKRLDRQVYEGRWGDAQGVWTSVNGFIIHRDATHWMPLPAPPSLPDDGSGHCTESTTDAGRAPGTNNNTPAKGGE